MAFRGQTAIKGKVVVLADDDTAGNPNDKTLGPKRTIVDENVTKGTASATGRVSDWNIIRGKANANKNAAAPKAAVATANSTNTATFKIELSDDDKFVLYIETKFTASLVEKDTSSSLKSTWNDGGIIL